MMRSIAAKLWLAFVTFAIVVLTVLGVFISQIFDEFYLNQQTQHLIDKGQIIAEILTTKGAEEKALLYAKVMSLDGSVNIAVTDHLGRVIGCAGSLHLPQGSKLTTSDIKDIQQGKLVVRKGKALQSNQESISVVIPVQNTTTTTQEKKSVDRAVLLYAPLAPITDTSKEIKLLIMVASLVAIGIATLLALMASRTISRPLLQINQAATRMIHGDFTNKLDITTEDEVGRLGRTLNILSTELQDNLDELSREKDQLNNIISSMTEGLVTFNLEGMVIQNNQPAAQLLQSNRRELAGKTLAECCQIKEIKDLYARMLQEKQKQQVDIVHKGLTLAVSMAPLRDSNQVMTGVVMVVRDISLEQRLEIMRRDFVTNVSHELRTPLCLILGYAEALDEGLAATEENRQEMTGIIREETNRLQRLVNDLLDLSKIESGNLQLNIGQVDVRALLEQAVHPFRPLARERNIELAVQIDSQVTCLEGDEDRLAQILINLLDNAMRYTPENGSIEITARKKGQSTELRIRDTGEGIPTDELPYIFERFYKVDKSRSRGSAGTGLGLAIVRSIIQAHSGTIRAESEPGLGTVFIINLK